MTKPPASAGLTLRPGRYRKSLHAWAFRSGLFVGAVVLALGYDLFLAWLRQGQPLGEEQGKS